MSNFIDYLFRNRPISNHSYAMLNLLFRLFAGGLMIPYGIGKIQNFNELSINFFEDPIGIGMYPSLILTIFAQVICATTLCLGVFTRISAAVLAFNMLVASCYHLFDGLATLSLPLLFLAIYCYIATVGASKYSLDYYLFSRKNTLN